MPPEPDTYAVEWLREQLAHLKGWRRASETGEGAPRDLAGALARHESWLEARLQDLTARRAA